MLASKLKKLKMPAKKGAEEAEMEGMEEMHSEEGEDSPELAAKEEELGMDLDQDMEEGESPEHKKKVLGKSSAALEAVSDDDLMAELKKRGLMSKLGEEEAAEGEEESHDLSSILA